MENGPPKWLPNGWTLFRGFGGLSLANWGELGQKLKRPISLFDQTRRKRVLTNWCWIMIPPKGQLTCWVAALPSNPFLHREVHRVSPSSSSRPAWCSSGRSIDRTPLKTTQKVKTKISPWNHCPNHRIAGKKINSETGEVKKESIAWIKITLATAYQEGTVDCRYGHFFIYLPSFVYILLEAGLIMGKNDISPRP